LDAQPDLLQQLLRHLLSLAHRITITIKDITKEALIPRL
jgi:hypothetical protein